MSVFQRAHGCGFVDDFDRLLPLRLNRQHGGSNGRRGSSDGGCGDGDGGGAPRALHAPASDGAPTALVAFAKDGVAAARGLVAGVAGGEASLAAAAAVAAVAAAEEAEAVVTGAGVVAAAKVGRVLSVVDGDGPRGVLLAFFDERGDNGALLRLLAACGADVEAACWGVFPLQPQERAGCSQPDGILPGAPGGPPATPTHADLLALECGVVPASELPALVLRTADLRLQLFACKGRRALEEPTRPAELCAKLQLLAQDQARVLAGAKQTNWWTGRHHAKIESAAAAAEWVRKRRFKLLLIEPQVCPIRPGMHRAAASVHTAAASTALWIGPLQGVLTKQCCKTVVPSAEAALGKRRTNAFGARKYDAFLPGCVRFLRALLLHHPAEEGDRYDPDSQYGDGPPPGVLRADAPRLALVTNLGHLASKTRPGAEAPWEVAEVRAVLAGLSARLASELGISPQQMSGLLGQPYVSYRAESAPPPAAGAAEEALIAREWSEAWCKPRPGMLLASMAEAGVHAHEALMVGFDYVDREAAHAAQTNYVSQEHLLGRFDIDEMDERLTIPSDEEAQGTKAPGNFAAQSKRAQAGTPPKKGARVF